MMRAGNRKGTGVPRSARRAGTGVHHGDELNGFEDDGPSSAFDVANALRHSMTTGQRANSKLSPDLRFVSGDELGHRSDPSDHSGRIPMGRLAVR